MKHPRLKLYPYPKLQLGDVLFLRKDNTIGKLIIENEDIPTNLADVQKNYSTKFTHAAICMGGRTFLETTLSTGSLLSSLGTILKAESIQEWAVFRHKEINNLHTPEKMQEKMAVIYQEYKDTLYNIDFYLNKPNIHQSQAFYCSQLVSKVLYDNELLSSNSINNGPTTLFLHMMSDSGNWQKIASSCNKERLKREQIIRNLDALESSPKDLSNANIISVHKQHQNLIVNGWLRHERNEEEADNEVIAFYNKSNNTLKSLEYITAVFSSNIKHLGEMKPHDPYHRIAKSNNLLVKVLLWITTFFNKFKPAVQNDYNEHVKRFLKTCEGDKETYNAVKVIADSWSSYTIMNQQTLVDNLYELLNKGKEVKSELNHLYKKFQDEKIPWSHPTILEILQVFNFSLKQVELILTWEGNPLSNKQKSECEQLYNEQLAAYRHFEKLT